jgi:DNA ligase-associated metallophosphoesterase
VKSTEVRVGGVVMELLPDRAVFLPHSRALIVADVHWGKSASFRAAAVPIPPGTTSNDLARLTAAIIRTDPSRLIVLGDLMHARSWKAEQTLAVITAWRGRHARLPITLVLGNHDIRAGDPAPELEIECRPEPVVVESLRLCHRPGQHETGYTLAGHVHPCFTLHGPGRQRERLPCFLLGRKTGVLPAFGSFTGMAPIIPDEGDQVFVVAGDAVVRVEKDE